MRPGPDSRGLRETWTLRTYCQLIHCLHRKTQPTVSSSPPEPPLHGNRHPCTLPSALSAPSTSSLAAETCRFAASNPHLLRPGPCFVELCPSATQRCPPCPQNPTLPLGRVGLQEVKGWRQPAHLKVKVQGTGAVVGTQLFQGLPHSQMAGDPRIPALSSQSAHQPPENSPLCQNPNPLRPRSPAVLPTAPQGILTLGA